jgi:branched-chain amino acid aminotransferase
VPDLPPRGPEVSEPIVFLSGRFVPASEASINIYDFGLVLGATLTEMTRTFGHRPFRLEDHIERLNRSCKFTGIEVPFDQGEMLTHSQQLIEANTDLLDPHQDLGVIHFITPGASRLYAIRRVDRDETCESTARIAGDAGGRGSHR